MIWLNVKHADIRTCTVENEGEPDRRKAKGPSRDVRFVPIMAPNGGNECRLSVCTGGLGQVMRL